MVGKRLYQFLSIERGAAHQDADEHSKDVRPQRVLTLLLLHCFGSHFTMLSIVSTVPSSLIT
jgi:hypothetical protein